MTFLSYIASYGARKPFDAAVGIIVIIVSVVVIIRVLQHMKRRFRCFVSLVSIPLPIASVKQLLSIYICH